ncbi:hypothetical protein KKC13_06105 [bacterium]|nr:hypothetical protein [bacterium]MBU1959179.1 hypothetical protein [bacterium]
MQNFFGFIDYKKTDFSIDNSTTKQTTVFYQHHNHYNFFLSYTMHSETHSLNEEKLFLLLNGSINNQPSLCTELNIQAPLPLLELLKASYLQWGITFIKKLEGTFSLILFDKEQDQLTLAKDKIGILPINFYHSDEIILFGSRLSDFKQAPGFTPQISPEGLSIYLQFGCIIQPNSIFKGCYKVKSGQANHFDLQKKEYFSTVHWSLESCYQEKKIFPHESKIITQAEQLLHNSIHKLRPKNEKIAVSLSGGYDSSTIAALLQEQQSSKVATFTIGFDHAPINEAPHAKAIAKHLGTQHHEHYFTAKNALEIIPKLSKIYDEPFADHAASPTLLTNELIKSEGIKNLFVGDGGDEVFATADDVHFFERIRNVPYGLRSFLLNPLKKIPMDAIPYLKDKYNLPTKCAKLLQILSAKNIPEMTEARNILFREKELQALIIEYHHPQKTTFNEIEFKGFNETVDEIIGTYFKTSMIDGELVKSYSASNHHNIAIKTPFLDEQLIAYMAKVPSSIKIKEGIKKYVLKEIAHKYMPKNLLNRPKSGFNIPFSSWMKNELKELLFEQINEERLNKDKLFYTSSILEIRDKFYDGNELYKYKLWRIFLFQLWYENFKG